MEWEGGEIIEHTMPVSCLLQGLALLLPSVALFYFVIPCRGTTVYCHVRTLGSEEARWSLWDRMDFQPSCEWMLAPARGLDW